MSKSRWTGGTVRQNLTGKIGHQRIQKISISKFFILKIFSHNLYACKGKTYNSAALIPLRSQTYKFTRCHVSIYHYVLSIIYLDKKFSNYGIYE